MQQLAHSLRTNKLSLHDHLAAVEQRFAEQESLIFSFLPEPRRWERLRQDADTLLAQHPDPENRPPLFGIPVGVKDIFHVDGFPTRAGSRLAPELFAGTESAFVTCLKQLGALILGKTATTEFAWFAPAATRNPHNPFHTPGGSSSGSAAAVAARLTPLALGSQTIGSINRPAAYCGVVGYKPSYDLYSRTGVIPLSESVDHVGFFTRTVADAAFVGEVVRGQGSGVRSQSEEVSKRPVLGVPMGAYLGEAHPDGLAHFLADVACLREAGFVVKEVGVMEDFERIRRDHLVLVSADAATYHARFSDYHHLYHEKTLDLIAAGQAHNADTYENARNSRLELRKRLEHVMDEHAIDLWLSPPAQGAAPAGHASTGDPVMNLPWTHAGMPTLSIPTGKNRAGLPLGLQLTARFGVDTTLFEQQILYSTLRAQA